MLRGGSALFAMSLGMGVPLLVVGASAGQLLPRVGPWMDAVKAAFGVMLLGVAVWMLGRLLPGPVTLALWAVLAFVAGFCLLTLGGREVQGGADAVRRGVGALAIVYGVLMLIGALAGRSDPLQPLAGLGAGAAEATESRSLAFQRIKTVADLERAVAAGQRQRARPVMLDFYADWCVSCKEMERYTFTDPAVQAELARAVLLQADVTANDAADQALLQRFGILGPPTIVFFGADGLERTDYRVVGYQPAESSAPTWRGPSAVGRDACKRRESSPLSRLARRCRRRCLYFASRAPAPVAATAPTPAAPRTVAESAAPRWRLAYSCRDLHAAGPRRAAAPLQHWPGKSLIVNFWATWCAPCRREIPLLEQLQAEHGAEGFQVIGVAVDFRDKVLAYAEEMKIDYPLLIGEQEAPRRRGGIRRRRRSAFRSRSSPTPRAASSPPTSGS